MRIVPLALLAMLVAIQFPLWLGKGGWMRVRDAERQLAAQNKVNADLTARNAKLAAEVKDLREGAGAVEERARYELGMIKDGEVFVQLVDPVAAAAAVPTDKPVIGNRPAAPPAAPAAPEKPMSEAAKKAAAKAAARDAEQRAKASR